MRALVLLFAAALCACGKPAAMTAPLYAELPASTFDAEAVPNGRLPADTHPLRYALELEIVPERPTFAGRVRIDVALDRPRESLYLHAKGLRASSVRVVRPSAEVLVGTLEPVSESGLSAVRLPQPVGPGVVRVEIDYEASFGAQLAGLYRVDVGGASYAFTQHEPISARETFPCFDEPRFKTPFDVTLRVRNDHVAIANARELESRALADDLRAVRFATTEKLPTYLVAFAVGPFDVVRAADMPATDVRPHALPLRAIAVKGRGPELAYALRETPRILEALERYFGSAYPYDKLDLIAVPDFSAGAMENAGAITFREQLLLLRDDASESQRRGFALVTAHELAHQWFGNLVTMPWWDDLWLNEAFATWMGTRVSAEVYPEYEPWLGALGYTHHAMDVDSEASARQIRQPIANDDDIGNAFDAITYSKGGAVLSMFERYLTPPVFRAGLRTYMERHRFGNATAHDLTAALAHAANDPAVDAAFFTFLEQPGVPLVTAKVDCASAPTSLVLRQTRYLPLGSSASSEALWRIPVCVRIGATPEPREVCTLLTEREARVPLEVEGCPAWVVPNAGAQSYYRWTLSAADLAALVERRQSLTTAEQMSLTANVFAGLRAGALELAPALDALMALGDTDTRPQLEGVLRALASTGDALLDDDARVLWRAEVARLVRPLYERLGLFAREASDADGETTLLRASVVRALGLMARDPALLDELARLGAAELGLGADPRLVMLSRDLVDVAVTAAVQQGVAHALERAIERLATTEDGIARMRLLTAVASSRDPALTDRVMALSLDERLRSNERLMTIMGQHGQPETRERAFAWLSAHLDELLQKLGDRRGARVIRATDSFCSDEAAQRVATLFEARIETLRGGRHELDLALENIRLCSAFAKAHAEAARAYYHVRATSAPTAPVVQDARTPRRTRSESRR